MLFLFPTAHDLPGGEDWTVCVDDRGAPVRRFSPRYYAELFADLGIETAACLSHTEPSASATLAASGIATTDLGLAEAFEEGAFLAAIDRLLVTCGAARGAVALHSGRGGEWPAWIGAAVEEVLVVRAGFEKGAAEAWMGMLCPWLL